MNSKRIVAHAALLGVALIYGANYTIAKEILKGDYMNPMALVFFRVFSSMILFIIIHQSFIKEKIDKADIGRLILCAIFGVVINQSFFITGLKYTTPINASVLMVTAPMLVLILAVFFGEERFTKSKILGIILGAAGTLILIFGQGDLSFGGTLKGNIFILINATSYALYLVTVKPLMKKYNPMTIVKWIFIFAFIPVTIFAGKDVLSTNWHLFTPGIWLAFVYVLLFVTFFSYLLNATALKTVKPSTVGIYIYLQPAIATIVALSVGKDELSFIKLIAGIIIILGVYLVSRKKTIQISTNKK